MIRGGGGGGGSQPRRQRRTIVVAQTSRSPCRSCIIRAGMVAVVRGRGRPPRFADAPPSDAASSTVWCFRLEWGHDNAALGWDAAYLLALCSDCSEDGHLSRSRPATTDAASRALNDDGSSSGGVALDGVDSSYRKDYWRSYWSP